MKYLTLITCIALLPVSSVVAEESAKSLASTLEIYVFPAEGQASEQQSKDEAECYNWAVSNTGSDPFDLQKQDAAVAAQAEEQVAHRKRVRPNATPQDI